jgi:hypothetical protein
MSQESSKRATVPALYLAKDPFGNSYHPHTSLGLENGATYLSNVIADMRNYPPPTRLEYGLSLISRLIDGHDQFRADDRLTLVSSAPILASFERRYDQARRNMEDILELLERTKHSKSKLTHRDRDAKRRPSEKVTDNRWFEVLVDDLGKLWRQLQELWAMPRRSRIRSSRRAKVLHAKRVN